MEISTDQEAQFRQEREQMVVEQIQQRGISSVPVLDAFREIPRHLFVAKDDQAEAYHDHPLPIGFGQTISQPFIVAFMTEKLQLSPKDLVLEIGTGSGYQAAILSCLCDTVHTVERIPQLGKQARERIHSLEIKNVFVHIADGTEGWVEDAPYDAIMVTAGAPDIPNPLKKQLKKGGRMILPIGNRWHQELHLVNNSDSGFMVDAIIPVVFVPLLGKWGWNEKTTRDDWF